MFMDFSTVSGLLQMIHFFAVELLIKVITDKYKHQFHHATLSA